MIPGKTSRHDLGPKTAYGVQTRTREIGATQVSDEERETNANGGEKGGLGFLNRKHEDSYDEESGQKHFNEKSLGNRGIVREAGVDGHRAGKHGGYEGGGNHSARQLRYKEECASNRRYGPAEDKTECYLDELLNDVSGMVRRVCIDVWRGVYEGVHMTYSRIE